MNSRGFLQGNQDIVADTGAQKLFSSLSVLVFAVAATMCFVAVGFVGWQKTMAIPGHADLDVRIGLNYFALDFDEHMDQMSELPNLKVLVADGKRATFMLPLPTDCTQFKDINVTMDNPADMPVDLETECDEWKSGRYTTMGLAITGGVIFTFASLLSYAGRTGSYKNGTRVAMYVAMVAALFGTTAGIVYSTTRQLKNPAVMALTKNLVMSLEQLLKPLDLSSLEMKTFGYHKSMFLVCLTSFVVPYSLIGIFCGFTNAVKK